MVRSQKFLSDPAYDPAHCRCWALWRSISVNAMLADGNGGWNSLFCWKITSPCPFSRLFPVHIFFRLFGIVLVTLACAARSFDKNNFCTNSTCDAATFEVEARPKEGTFPARVLGWKLPSSRKATSFVLGGPITARKSQPLYYCFIADIFSKDAFSTSTFFWNETKLEV